MMMMMDTGVAGRAGLWHGPGVRPDCPPQALAGSGNRCVCCRTFVVLPFLALFVGLDP
jgi:hypothetical protein